MKYAVLGLSAIGLLVLLAVMPTVAHHEIAAKFDTSKPNVSIKGIVTKFDWTNPHAHVFINVSEAGGRITNWAVELESPVDLVRGGWNRESLKPGDAVSVDGTPARDGSKQLWMRSFTLTAGNKKMFDIPAPARPTAAAKPTPKWPDGQPRLGPPTGEAGYWARPSQTSLIQDGANVKTSEYGLLANMADIDKVAPFQRWARDLYELRQRNFLKDDPIYLHCLPPGGPRQFQMPHGIQFVEDRERKRIFVLVGDVNRNYRIIYLDGRQQRGQVRGDDDNPLYYGRAVGKWVGETLEVDTRGFNDKFWFSNGGLPHTDQLHLVERFSRPDMNTLKYSVTINDPGAYTKDWTSSWTLQWMAGEELPIFFCQDNRP